MSQIEGSGGTSHVRRTHGLFDKARSWVRDHLPKVDKPKPTVEPDRNTASGHARYAAYEPEVDFGAGRGGRASLYGAGRGGRVSLYGDSSEAPGPEELDPKKRGHLTTAAEQHANAMGDDMLFIRRARIEGRNSQVPIDKDQLATFEKLDDDAKGNFRRLSQGDRQRYVELDRSLTGRPHTQDTLRGVLSAGNLNHPGMLDSLQQIAKGPLAPQLAGLDKDELLATHLRQLNMEGAVYQGASNFCGPAAAQEAMIHQDPARYSRMVADLLTKGKADLPNGDTLEADLASFFSAKTESNQAHDRRSDLDSVLLSSLHNYARQESSVPGKGPNDPLSEKQIAALMKATLPRNTTLEVDDSRKAQNAAQDLIVKALLDNKSVPVGITVDRNGRPDADSVTGHMVTLTDVEVDKNGQLKSLVYASEGKLVPLKGKELAEFMQSLRILTAPSDDASKQKALDAVDASDQDFGTGRYATSGRMG